MKTPSLPNANTPTSKRQNQGGHGSVRRFPVPPRFGSPTVQVGSATVREQLGSARFFPIRFFAASGSARFKKVRRRFLTVRFLRRAGSSWFRFQPGTVPNGSVRQPVRVVTVRDKSGSGPVRFLTVLNYSALRQKRFLTVRVLTWRKGREKHCICHCFC